MIDVMENNTHGNALWLGSGTKCGVKSITCLFSEAASEAYTEGHFEHPMNITVIWSKYKVVLHQMKSRMLSLEDFYFLNFNSKFCHLNFCG